MDTAVDWNLFLQWLYHLPDEESDVKDLSFLRWAEGYTCKVLYSSYIPLIIHLVDPLTIPIVPIRIKCLLHLLIHLFHS